MWCLHMWTPGHKRLHLNTVTTFLSFFFFLPWGGKKQDANTQVLMVNLWEKNCNLNMQLIYLMKSNTCSCFNSSCVSFSVFMITMQTCLPMTVFAIFSVHWVHQSFFFLMKFTAAAGNKIYITKQKPVGWALRALLIWGNCRVVYEIMDSIHKWAFLNTSCTYDSR